MRNMSDIRKYTYNIHFMIHTGSSIKVSKRYQTKMQKMQKMKENQQQFVFNKKSEMEENKQ